MMQVFWTNSRLKAYNRQLEGTIAGLRTRHKQAIREMVANIRILAQDKASLTESLAILGAYLKNVEAGRDALQKSCGDTLEELRMLRKLEEWARRLHRADGADLTAQPPFTALDLLRAPKP